LFTDEDRKIEDKKMEKKGRKILRKENEIQKSFCRLIFLS